MGRRWRQYNSRILVRPAGPKVIEFGKELSKGSNKVEIRRAGDSGALQVNVIATYYVPGAVASRGGREIKAETRQRLN